MATTRELEDMQTAMLAELDGFGVTLASHAEQLDNAAGWIATLIRLLMDSGAISRSERAFAPLFSDAATPCLFCGEVH